MQLNIKLKASFVLFFYYRKILRAYLYYMNVFYTFYYIYIPSG